MAGKCQGYSFHFCQLWAVKVRFLFICVFRKNMFLCNSMGNFEAIKGLLLKNAPYFPLIFAEIVTPLSLNIIKLIPFGASVSKYKKFAFPMWIIRGWILLFSFSNIWSTFELLCIFWNTICDNSIKRETYHCIPLSECILELQSS